MSDICALVVRFEPSLGALVRETVEEFKDIISRKRTWQEGNSAVTAIVLNLPDTNDEGNITSGRYSVDDLIRKLKVNGAAVETREKVS